MHILAHLQIKGAKTSSERDSEIEMIVTRQKCEVSQVRFPPFPLLFPQTGLPVGLYLRKKETGHAGGRAGLCWAWIWLCCMGALGWVGRVVWLW